MFLSDDEDTYIADTYVENGGFNVPDPPVPIEEWDPYEYPGIVGYYACYLYMLDNDTPPITRYGDRPEYPGLFPDGTYATIVDRIYGIQHAEGTFGTWNSRTIYIYIGGQFGGNPLGMFEGTYSTDINLAVYSL